MASTTTLKYGPKISLSHVTMRGGGGPDPFIVKDYEKGPFLFLQPSLNFLKSSDRADSEYVSKQIFRWVPSEKYPNFGFSDTHRPCPGPEGLNETQQITHTTLLAIVSCIVYRTEVY